MRVETTMLFPLWPREVGEVVAGVTPPPGNTLWEPTFIQSKDKPYVISLTARGGVFAM